MQCPVSEQAKMTAEGKKKQRKKKKKDVVQKKREQKTGSDNFFNRDRNFSKETQSGGVALM